MSATVKKRERLKKLSADAKKSLYEMLKITDEIFRDKDYVDEHGGESPLMLAIESDEFAHFGGTPSLAELLRAYRHNPEREVWEENRFNWRVMIDLAKPARESGESLSRVNWKAKAKELEAENERLKSEVDRLRTENANLSARVGKLTESVAELKGELRAVERLATA